MDLTKLTPAPWYAHNPDDSSFMNVFCVTNSPHEPDTEIDDTAGIIAGTLIQTPLRLGQWHDNWETDAEFIALARNAFEVMMRRGWGLISSHDGTWGVSKPGHLPTRLIHLRWPDPFTALVEADKWMTEFEAKGATE